MMQCHVTVGPGTVAFVTVRNLGVADMGDESKDPSVWFYHWEIYDPNKAMLSGQLVHDRSDGWHTLIRKVLEEAEKQR